MMLSSPILQTLLLPGDLFGRGGVLDDLLQTVAAVICVIALIECFFGFRLFRIWIAICGFFLFGALGTAVAYALSDKAGIALFVGILTAIAGAFVAYRLYLAGVFLSCGLMGYILGYLLTGIYWPGIVLGLVFGVLGVLFVKPVVILSTAISGGLLAGFTLVIVFGGSSRAAALLLGLLLAAAGVYVQWVTNRKVPAPAFVRAGAGQAAARTTPDGSRPDKAGDAMDRLRKRALDMSRMIGDNLRKRVERERQAALRQESGMTLEQALAAVEERLYANRMMAYVMPFAEMALLVAAVFSFIFSFRLFSVLHAHFVIGALLAFLAALCWVKRSYPVLAVSALLVAFGKLIAFIKWVSLPDYYSFYVSTTRYIVMSLIDLLLAGAAACFAVRAALRPEQVEVMKDFGRRLRKSLAGTGPDTGASASCPDCGASNDETARFCNACGAELVRQQA